MSNIKNVVCHKIFEIVSDFPDIYLQVVRDKKKNNKYLNCIMRKPDFCICKNKGVDQLCSNFTAQLISAFVSLL